MRIAALAAVVLLAGCGAGAEGNTGAAAEEPGTELVVTVWPEGRDGDSTQVMLECDPVGGDHPNAEAACALVADPSALAPVPEGTMCTMIFGGPEQARVEGHIGDTEVDERFSRANGCEIERWRRLEPLFAVN